MNRAVILVRLLGVCIPAGLWAASALAQAPAAGGGQPPPSTGVGPYIAGIEALESGDYSRAVADLSRAIQADDENADYLCRRGVASTLAEKFPDAIADLQRAMKLRGGNDREAQLWLGAAYRMNGDWQKGAMNFTHGGDVPADYASLVYNDMAMEYATSRYNHVYFDRETHRQVQTAETVKRRFPDVARAYAQRHKASGPAAAEALLGRVKDSIEHGDWPGAIRDLRLLRQQSPDDLALRQYWARALLETGDVLDARTEFTRALSQRRRGAKVTWAGPGPGGMRRLQPRHRRSRRRRRGGRAWHRAGPGGDSPAAGPPAEDAADRFARATQADAPFPELADAALALRRWENARRFWYDQAYQDRIRLLDQALRHEPQRPDAPDVLARFLYQHYRVPVVWDGPRSDGLQLRPQSAGDRAQELKRCWIWPIWR